MGVIDNAYTYYLTTYGNRTGSRYDTHKKSELRNVYNQIVKLNKEAPLYKFPDKTEVAKFAIDIKESAQNIKNVIASISGSDDIMKSLQKKSAVSSQEDIVSASYIGADDDDTTDIQDFKIEVRQLAKNQINIGNFLKSNHRDLAPGPYSFDLSVGSAGYEFQFNVNAEDTNHSVQTKLANLISNAGIGLTASVLEDASGQSALKIESLQTGSNDNDTSIFNISAAGTANSGTALNILGISHISQEAQNSSFLLNGTPRTAHANTFSINNMFELTLKGISAEGEAATVGFKPDTQSVMESIQSLTEAYNSIIETTDKHSGSHNQKLRSHISNAVTAYMDELDKIGLHKDENDHLSVDSSTLKEIIESDTPSQQLSILNDFKQTLNAKVSLVSLNPMDYVDKVVVTYKNPGRNFVAPYMPSNYSGMMIDKLC